MTSEASVGAESFDRKEIMEESKPVNNDPHCEDGADNRVGGEEVSHEDATSGAAAEEIEELSPLPISIRPTLNSLTSGTVPMIQCLRI